MVNSISAKHNISLPRSTNPEALPIPGMLYIPNFLTPTEQATLLQTIDSFPYIKQIHRRQQMYGEVYYHTTHDIPQLQPKVEASDLLDRQETACNTASAAPLSLDSLQWVINKFFTEPLSEYEIFNLDKSNYPTQVLVNEYIGNQGISSHFDDFDAFDSVIATVSLVNPIWMTLKKPKHIRNHCQTILEETRILLEPGSLLIMKDDLRYRWRHGIGKFKWMDLPSEGTSTTKVKRDENFRRVSLTIRKLLNGRKRVGRKSDGWVTIDNVECNCLRAS